MEEEKKKVEENEKLKRERRHQQNVKGNQERLDIEKEQNWRIGELAKSENVSNIVKNNEFKL